MIFRSLYVLSVMVTFAACSNHSLTKRHLDWVEEPVRYEIKSSSTEVGNIVVDHLTSYELNEVLDPNKNYLSFVLYRRNGAPLLNEPTGGVFYFVPADEADKLKTKCARPTLHAGAYHSVYKKCPENDNLLVASGYCYQGSKIGLVFNSATFNKRQNYIDKRYYMVETDWDYDRQVHIIERGLLTMCFNNWKNDRFAKNWKCEFNKISMMQYMAQVAVSEDKNLDECNSCDQPCSSSASSFFNYGNEIAGYVVMLLSVSWYIALGLLN